MAYGRLCYILTVLLQKFVLTLTATRDAALIFFTAQLFQWRGTKNHRRNLLCPCWSKNCDTPVRQQVATQHHSFLIIILSSVPRGHGYF